MKSWQILVVMLCVLFGSACSEGNNQKAALKELGAPLLSPSVTLLHHMQGKWADASHEDAHWEINGNKVNAYYKDILKVYTIKPFDKLPEKVDGKSKGTGIGYFVTTEKSGSYCYELFSLENYQMHYEPVGPILD